MAPLAPPAPPAIGTPVLADTAAGLVHGTVTDVAEDGSPVIQTAVGPVAVDPRKVTPLPVDYEAQRVAHGAPLEQMPQAIADVGEYQRAAPKDYNIFQAMKDLGGIRNQRPDGSPEGDVKQILDKVRYPALVNNKSGLSPDEMRAALQQQGWFGEFDQGQQAEQDGWSVAKPGDDINELYELMRRQAAAKSSGKPVLHPSNETAETTARRAELDQQMNEAGVQRTDAPDMAAAKLAAWRGQQVLASGPDMEALHERADQLGVRRRVDTPYEDLLHDVLEREAIQAESDGWTGDHYENLEDAVLSSEEHEWLTAAGRSPESERDPAFPADAVVEAARDRAAAPQGAGEAGQVPGAGGENAQGLHQPHQLASEKVRLAGETADQLLIPGAERSAKQAAEARGEGPIRAKARQREADEGLFAPPKEPELFDLKPTKATPEAKQAEAEAKGKGYGESNTLFTKEQAEAARKRLRDKLRNQLNAGLDPDLIHDGILLAGYHVEAGARLFGDFAKAMIEDLGEQARPYLKMWYESLRHYPGFDAQGLTPTERITPEVIAEVGRDVSGGGEGLERRGAEPAAADAHGPGAVPTAAGQAERGPGGPGTGPAATGAGPQDSLGLPDRGAAVVGEPGAPSSREGAPGAAGQPAGRGQPVGSGAPRDEGVQPDRLPATDLAGAADEAAHLEPITQDAHPFAESVNAPSVPDDLVQALPTLFPEQRSDVAFAEQRFAKDDGHGVLFTNGTGTGKAAPLDSPILTPTGWTTMGAISVGDEVVAVDGQPTRVVAVFPQGEKPNFRVLFSDGASTECCDEHLWETQTLYQRRKARTHPHAPFVQPTVKSLAEIRATLDKRHFIPIVAPVVFESRGELPIAPYVLGALIGDGNFSQSAVTISNPDAEIIERIRAELPSGILCVQMPSEGRCPAYRLSEEVRQRAVNGTQERGRTHKALIDLGLMGMTSERKFLPEDYLRASIEDRVALLQGLMDTDGYRDAKCNAAYYTTVSSELADDVTELVRSLGGVVSRSSKMPTYTYKGERRIGKRAYTLCIRTPNDIQPFHLSRKRMDSRTWGLPKRAIVAIEYVGRKPAQCIRVDHPRRLYVASDYIVTHNTFTGGGLAKRFYDAGKKNILIVAPSQGILSHWVEAMEKLGVPFHVLEDTARAGEGPVGTTYAALTTNDALADRKWDLVIGDEAHTLSSDQAGSETTALKNFRALTLHPDRLYRRAEMDLRADVAKVAAIRPPKNETWGPAYETWRRAYNELRRQAEGARRRSEDASAAQGGVPVGDSVRLRQVDRVGARLPVQLGARADQPRLQRRRRQRPVLHAALRLPHALQQADPARSRRRIRDHGAAVPRVDAAPGIAQRPRADRRPGLRPQVRARPGRRGPEDRPGAGLPAHRRGRKIPKPRAGHREALRLSVQGPTAGSDQGQGRDPDPAKAHGARA